MSRLKHRRKRLSSFQMILLGFAGVIVLGALILMLPISSTQGIVTSFDKTLFTTLKNRQDISSHKPRLTGREIIIFIHYKLYHTKRDLTI